MATKNSKVRKENTIQRLTQLDAEEVSVVTKGANKKTFSIVKSEHGLLISKALEGDQDSLQEVMKLLIEKCSDETKVAIGIAKEDTTLTEPTAPATTEPTEEPVSSIAKEDFDALNTAVKEVQDQIAKMAGYGDEIKKLKDDPRFAAMDTRITKISNNTNPQTTEPTTPEDITKADSSDNMSTLGMKSLSE